MSSKERLSVRTLVGAAVTLFGVALALDALDLVETDRFMRFWPLVLIAIGVLLLMRVGGGGPWFPGALLTLLGTGLLLRELGLLPYGLDAIWPLIIILVGLGIISRGFKPRPGSGAPESDDTVSSFVVLCGSNLSSSSQAFRGGDLSALMGGVRVDLTQADLAEGEAVLDLFAMMGGIEIRVPPQWTVDSRVTPFMGGMEDATDRSESDPSKRLLIKGFVMMGGVEVKN